MLTRLLNFCRQHHIAFKTIFVILVLVLVAFIGLLVLAKYHATSIFARVAASQKVLKGNISAESVYVNYRGDIYLENLHWEDEGEPIAHFPNVRLRLNYWDVVRRHINANSIEELELKQPVLRLVFNDMMQLDVMRKLNEEDKQVIYDLKNNIRVKDERLDKFRERHETIKFTDGTLPNTKLIIQDGNILARHRDKIWHIKRVNMDAKVTEHRFITLRFNGTEFGGTMKGDGIDLNGTIDLKQNAQQLHMYVGFYNVVPQSLGLGKVSDPITITGEVTGSPQKFVIDGALQTPKLAIPPLQFRELSGLYHYENGVATFKDVETTLYDGQVAAYGLYNFHNRSYRIIAHGSRLQASQALKNLHAHVKAKVDVDLELFNDGNAKNTVMFGTLHAEDGSVYFVPFDELNAKFDNQRGRTDFTDVSLRTGVGTLFTDKIYLKRDGLEVGELYLITEEGERLVIREPLKENKHQNNKNKEK